MRTVTYTTLTLCVASHVMDNRCYYPFNLSAKIAKKNLQKFPFYLWLNQGVPISLSISCYELAFNFRPAYGHMTVIGLFPVAIWILRTLSIMSRKAEDPVTMLGRLLNWNCVTLKFSYLHTHIQEKNCVLLSIIISASCLSSHFRKVIDWHCVLCQCSCWRLGTPF